MKRAAVVVGAVVVLGVVLGAASCSTPGVEFPPDGSGGAGATANGGTGGTPFSCDDCAAPDLICVDGSECSATCPDSRDACHTSADPDAAFDCCAAGQQCCSAVTFGYAGGDLCIANGDLCPFTCPGGDVSCTAGQYCALDPETSTYSCVASCDPTYTCDELCCPLGATCGAGGGCVLPDLSIDGPHIAATYVFENYTFQQGSCSFFEGCIGALGDRRLLRFDLRTPNHGDGDLFLGSPFQNPLFVWSSCHQHYHFEGYARYRLLDQNLNIVATGHKQAFCLLDWEPVDPSANPDPVYSCDYQGIQKGWADTYENDLPCQWVDVTDVPPGEYILEVAVNEEHALGELDYTNNLAQVPVTIP